MPDERGGLPEFDRLGLTEGRLGKQVDVEIAKRFNELSKAKQMQWTKLAGAGAFAVLGVSLLTILSSGGAPPGKHLAVAFYLLLITLPVSAAYGVGLYLWLNGARNIPVLLGLSVVAGFVGVTTMGRLVGDGLAGFYCYNNGAVQEAACRKFNEAGFYAAGYSAGSPGQSVEALGGLLVFTVDARGWLMVLCGVIAADAAARLLHLEQQPSIV